MDSFEWVHYQTHTSLFPSEVTASNPEVPEQPTAPTHEQALCWIHSSAMLVRAIENDETDVSAVLEMHQLLRLMEWHRHSCKKMTLKAKLLDAVAKLSNVQHDGWPLTALRRRAKRLVEFWK